MRNDSGIVALEGGVRIAITDFRKRPASLMAGIQKCWRSDCLAPC